MFMKEPIKGDSIYVLNHSIQAILTEESPSQTLRELSNRVIHNASIFQDEDSVSVAVLIYALSKVIQSYCEKEMNFKQFAKPLQNMKGFLSKNNYKLYNSELRKIISSIKKADKKLKEYMQEVFDRSKIKKGSKLHEHGISIARTANLLGITQWELQQYVGIHPSLVKEEFSVIKRLNIARGLFK